MKARTRKSSTTFEIGEIDRRAFLKLAAAAGLVCACGLNALEAATECTERRKETVKPEDLITYCGLYCGSCARWIEYTAFRNMAKLLAEIADAHGFQHWMPGEVEDFDYAQFRKGLDFFSKDDTWFVCRQGCKTNDKMAHCRFRKCAKERGVELCFDCAEFPCDQVKGNTVMLKRAEEYRKLGKKEWLRQIVEKAEQGFEFHTKKYYQACAAESPPSPNPHKGDR